jgi:hypothetical protein
MTQKGLTNRGPLQKRAISEAHCANNKDQSAQYACGYCALRADRVVGQDARHQQPRHGLQLYHEIAGDNFAGRTIAAVVS